MKVSHRQLYSRFVRCKTIEAIQMRQGNSPIKQPNKCKGCPASKILLEHPKDKRITYIQWEPEAIQLANKIRREQENQ